MEDNTPKTNKVFSNSIPFVQDSEERYAIPVANPDGTPISGGADVTLGSKADPASTATDATPASVISILKQISKVDQDVWNKDNNWLNVSLLSVIDRINDSITAYPKAGIPVNLTASGQILAVPGQILGFFVNSTTGGTVRIADNTAAGSGYFGVAITPAAGQYYPYPANLTVGGYVTITNTIDVTFFVIPIA